MFLPSSDGPNLEAILEEVGLPGFKIMNSYDFEGITISFRVNKDRFETGPESFIRVIIDHMNKLPLVAEAIEKLKQENDKLLIDNIKYKNYFELQKEIEASKKES